MLREYYCKLKNFICQIRNTVRYSIFFNTLFRLILKYINIYDYLEFVSYLLLEAEATVVLATPQAISLFLVLVSLRILMFCRILIFEITMANI